MMQRFGGEKITKEAYIKIVGAMQGIIASYREMAAGMMMAEKGKVKEEYVRKAMDRAATIESIFIQDESDDLDDEDEMEE
jgi:hypothetical protein